MEKLSNLHLLGFAISLTSPALRRRAWVLLAIRASAWLVARLSGDLQVPIGPWWVGALVDARARVSGRSRDFEAYFVLLGAVVCERVFARNPRLRGWPFAQDDE